MLEIVQEGPGKRTDAEDLAGKKVKMSQSQKWGKKTEGNPRKIL